MNQFRLIVSLRTDVLDISGNITYPRTVHIVGAILDESILQEGATVTGIPRLE